MRGRSSASAARSSRTVAGGRGESGGAGRHRRRVATSGVMRNGLATGPWHLPRVTMGSVTPWAERRSPRGACFDSNVRAGTAGAMMVARKLGRAWNPRFQHRNACKPGIFGRLAQLGEHQLDKLGVTGSSPVPPIHGSPAKAGFLFAIKAVGAPRNAPDVSKMSAEECRFVQPPSRSASRSQPWLCPHVAGELGRTRRGGPSPRSALSDCSMTRTAILGTSGRSRHSPIF